MGKTAFVDQSFQRPCFSAIETGSHGPVVVPIRAVVVAGDQNVFVLDRQAHQGVEHHPGSTNLAYHDECPLPIHRVHRERGVAPVQPVGVHSAFLPFLPFLPCQPLSAHLAQVLGSEPDDTDTLLSRIRSFLRTASRALCNTYEPQHCGHSLPENKPALVSHGNGRCRRTDAFGRSDENAGSRRIS